MVVVEVKFNFLYMLLEYEILIDKMMGDIVVVLMVVCNISFYRNGLLEFGFRLFLYVF